MYFFCSILFIFSLAFVSLDPWYRFYFYDNTSFDYCRKITDTKKEISIDHIQKVVSDYFQMDVSTLQSKTRKTNQNNKFIF